MDQFGVPTGRNPDGSVSFDSDPRAVMSIVRFYKRSLPNQFKSEQAGMPVSDYVDFVEVITAGDKSTVTDIKVTNVEKRMYAQQWHQYITEQEQTPEGVPLIHLFPAHPQIVDTLKSHKFWTIEQLAGASDTAMQSVPMGGFEYREKAKKYLEFSKDAGKFLAIERSIAEKDSRIGQLEETIKAMMTRLEELGAAGPPPKHPRRVQADA